MKNLLLGCALLVASGTAFANDLDKSEGPALQGKRVYVYVREPVHMVALTQESLRTVALGGALLAAVIADKEVPIDPQSDPAGIVGPQLAAALAAAYGAAPSQTGTPEYEVQVRTVDWGYRMGLVHSDRYNMYVGMSVHLVRSSDRETIASGNCFEDTSEHDNRPTIEQMRANKSALIGELSAHLAWRCLHKVATKDFGIDKAHVAPTPADLVDPLSRLQVIPFASKAPPLSAQERARRQGKALVAANRAKREAEAKAKADAKAQAEAATAPSGADQGER